MRVDISVLKILLVGCDLFHGISKKEAIKNIFSLERNRRGSRKKSSHYTEIGIRKFAKQVNREAWVASWLPSIGVLISQFNSACNYDKLTWDPEIEKGYDRESH